MECARIFPFVEYMNSSNLEVLKYKSDEGDAELDAVYEKVKHLTLVSIIYDAEDKSYHVTHMIGVQK